MGKSGVITKETTKDILRDMSERMAMSCPGERIEIRAVGGFAMVQRGLRGPAGMTLDIDTATPDYPASVVRCMHETADEYGLERDWLNNECVFSFADEVSDDDVAYFDEMLDAEYEPSDDYGNIKVSIASLDTLARAKAYALSDEFTGVGLGRDQTKDQNDLVTILRVKGYDTYEEVLDKEPWISSPEFSGCLTPLRKAFEAIADERNSKAAEQAVETDTKGSVIHKLAEVKCREDDKQEDDRSFTE